MFFVTEHEMLSGELETFHSCFTKPQWKHFKTYFWGLVLGEKGEKNVMDIATNALDGKDQSSLNRFLSSSTWDPNRLTNIRLSTYLPKQRGGVLCLDDTLMEKYGKLMEAAGWLHDHTKRKDIWAHDIVSTFYANDQIKVPMHLIPYVKEELCVNENHNFKTKIHLAIELFRKAFVFVKPEIVAFDSWYFGKDLIQFLNSYQQNWVTQSKSNRLINKDDKWISLKTLFKQIEHSSYQRIKVDVEEKKYRWYSETVLPMKHVGMVKIVLLKRRKNGRKFKALVTNYLTCPGDEVIKYYKKRWDIEVFYRDCKQFLGLGEYQMRGLRPVVIHLQLVFLAYTLLKNCRGSGTHFIMKGLDTIGSICVYLKRWMLKKLLSLRKKIVISLG